MGAGSSANKGKERHRVASNKAANADDIDGGVMSVEEGEFELYLEDCDVNLEEFGQDVWKKSDVTVLEGIMTIGEHVDGPSMENEYCEILLTPDHLPDIKIEFVQQHYELMVIQDNKKIRIRTVDEQQAQTWLKLIRYQIVMTSNTDSVFSSKMFDSKSMEKDEIEHMRRDSAVAMETKPSDFKLPEKYVGITAPKMNIAILVVGTRGDVQPFVYLGQQLQKDGHRVRLATHAEYREDVITKGGLEYYPLGGDPRKLSEYMVKTGGRLIPDLLNKEERAELPEKMKMLKEICYSCWPAVTQTDPEDKNSNSNSANNNSATVKPPFIADAIISNPVACGHIHCAQALYIPLHIMFPQPWSPTMCFPHPLSNLKLKSKWSSKNYYSYFMVNELMWLGLGSMINQFRQEVLQIRPIRIGDCGSSILHVNEVPISHMWSPSFVPKCQDWSSHVDVVGEFRLMKIEEKNVYKPSETLTKFLETCEKTGGTNTKPIYIGFGSMVIENATKLLDIIKEAAKVANVKVLLQNGWTKYAAEDTMITDEILVIGAMPHDYLFQHVGGVIHHGGAGTTSAGLRAGNPTFICPFFGDQHFWAEMVYRSGAGPKGCPVRELTCEKLADSFRILCDKNTIMKAQELGNKMSGEDGCVTGVNSFYRNLPLDKMICDVSIFHKQQSKLARFYCATCGLKMCAEMDTFIHRVQTKDNKDIINSTSSASSSSGDTASTTTTSRHLHKRVPYKSMLWGQELPSTVIDTTNNTATINSSTASAAVSHTSGVESLSLSDSRPSTDGGGSIRVGTVESKVVVEKKGYSRQRIHEGMKSLFTRGNSKNAVNASSTSAETVSIAATAGVNTTTTASGSKPITVSTSTSTRTSGNLNPTFFPPNLSEDFHILTPEELLMEQAYTRAMAFATFWKTIDSDGDQHINENELSKFLVNKDLANNMMEKIDWNGDRMLTFSELAWLMSQSTTAVSPTASPTNRKAKASSSTNNKNTNDGDNNSNAGSNGEITDTND